MSIRPQDLPEFRAEAVRALSHPETVAKLKDFEGWLRQFDQVMPAEDCWVREADTLRSADLFYVSDDMAHLAIAAGASIPSFTPNEHDLPSVKGFMVFERPIADMVHAVSWIVRPTASTAVIWVCGYVDIESEKGRRPSRFPRYLPWRYMPMFLGDLESRASDLRSSEDQRACRALASAWMLMQQPLAREDMLQPDRHTRKRLTRAGHQPASVRVIELRRPPSSGSGDGVGNYHHQWIVRGHWRQHWYPKRQVHRPVWIAPHIKGPEGAPLIGGEKVYAWKR